MRPTVTFEATLITRGGGTGAKRVMEENPERVGFIRAITGWDKVEPGTLTMDHAQPCPVPALEGTALLGTEPEGLLVSPKPRDAHIESLRGPPSYYCGIAHSNDRKYRVVLSQQPRPAVKDRLEIIADERLRDVLEIEDGDKVRVEIFEPEDWPSL